MKPKLFLIRLLQISFILPAIIATFYVFIRLSYFQFTKNILNKPISEYKPLITQFTTEEIYPYISVHNVIIGLFFVFFGFLTYRYVFGKNKKSDETSSMLVNFLLLLCLPSIFYFSNYPMFEWLFSDFLRISTSLNMETTLKAAGLVVLANLTIQNMGHIDVNYHDLKERGGEDSDSDRYYFKNYGLILLISMATLLTVLIIIYSSRFVYLNYQSLFTSLMLNPESIIFVSILILILSVITIYFLIKKNLGDYIK